MLQHLFLIILYLFLGQKQQNWQEILFFTKLKTPANIRGRLCTLLPPNNCCECYEECESDENTAPHEEFDYAYHVRLLIF